MKVIFYLFSIFILTGCSFKTAFLKPDIVEQKTLAWTQKGEIYNSLEVKASMIATYLNPLDKNYKDGEYFLINIYIDNDYEDPKKYGLNNKDYILILNGLNYVYKKELNKDSKLAKMMPFFDSNWGHLYLVKFPKQNSKVLKLVLVNENYGTAEVKFQKP